ncbi:hypothetical protein B0T16DRAFT_99378 [Cercophora newfieldiana]|uniref:Uncharacterized protein n=1 Tax=Cercophora newfieldiana TaxID=92897 RepID=A0AA40CUT3_9PEZI|nr:hypothetical protein B0T16DRAFT_99378 [Cercophora newfieldiana]
MQNALHQSAIQQQVKQEAWGLRRGFQCQCGFCRSIAVTRRSVAPILDSKSQVCECLEAVPPIAPVQDGTGGRDGCWPAVLSSEPKLPPRCPAMRHPELPSWSMVADRLQLRHPANSTQPERPGAVWPEADGECNPEGRSGCRCQSSGSIGATVVHLQPLPRTAGYAAIQPQAPRPISGRYRQHHPAPDWSEGSWRAGGCPVRPNNKVHPAVECARCAIKPP